MNVNDKTKANILVVDDDPQILDLMKAAFEEGYSVFTAEDGNKALELLGRQTGIDVVITDIMMPGKEGVGLIRSIRRNDKEIKIIAMTSATNHENILNSAIKFGADETFQKHLNINVLIGKVNSLIS